MTSEKEAPAQIWVVIDDQQQPDFAASHLILAHDHISDYAGDPDVSVEGWVVRKYVLAERADECARLLTYAITHSNGRHLFADSFIRDAKAALGIT